MRRTRHRNGGLRKRCGCPRKVWPKCPHSWHFNYKPRGGPPYRIGLDREIGRHIDSKSEAETEAARIRVAIDEGKFVSSDERRITAAAVAITADAITMESFGQRYLDRHAKICGKKRWKNDAVMLNRLAAFALPETNGPTALGSKPLGAVTADDLELFFADLRRQGRAASTRNKYVQMCHAMFRWGVKKGYLTRNLIADSETIRREKTTQRKRRLEPDVFDANGRLVRPGEEQRLLRTAPPHLQRLIIAALETGCRRGELLSLTWAHVDLSKRELTVRAEHAKDREERILPISSRLVAVLEMARTDPGSREYPPTAYVFGELGRRLKSIKKAWETAVLRAHGHEPKWKGSSLSMTSRAHLRAIDLHFHDLRHEAGSRFIEAGWPVHHVQEMLGHASLEQTSTYLNVTRAGLHESMRRFEQTRNRCTRVAQTSAIEHPPLSNVPQETDAQPLIN